MGWKNGLRDNKGRYVKKTKSNAVKNWFKKFFKWKI